MKWIVNWLRIESRLLRDPGPVLPRRVDVEIPGHLERLADPAGFTMARVRATLREAQLLVRPSVACASRRVSPAGPPRRSRTRWASGRAVLARIEQRCGDPALDPREDRDVHHRHVPVAQSRRPSLDSDRPCRSATACALGLSRSWNPERPRPCAAYAGGVRDRRSHQRRQSRSAPCDAPGPGSRRSL